MSWTSKWRIPSVRRIASRAAAKTSGSDVVEDGLEALVSSLLARALANLAAALEVGVVQLVLGRLVGDGGLVDLLADVGDPLADLVVGERLDLRLEPVDLVDERLDASKLAVVRVDETIEKTQNHSRGSIGEAALRPGSGLARAAPLAQLPAVGYLAISQMCAARIDEAGRPHAPRPVHRAVEEGHAATGQFRAHRVDVIHVDRELEARSGLARRTLAGPMRSGAAVVVQEVDEHRPEPEHGRVGILEDRPAGRRRPGRTASSPRGRRRTG